MRQWRSMWSPSDRVIRIGEDSRRAANAYCRFEARSRRAVQVQRPSGKTEIPDPYCNQMVVAVKTLLVFWVWLIRSVHSPALRRDRSEPSAIRR